MRLRRSKGIVAWVLSFTMILTSFAGIDMHAGIEAAGAEEASTGEAEPEAAESEMDASLDTSDNDEDTDITEEASEEETEQEAEEGSAEETTASSEDDEEGTQDTAEETSSEIVKTTWGVAEPTNHVYYVGAEYSFETVQVDDEHAEITYSIKNAEHVNITYGPDGIPGTLCFTAPGSIAVEYEIAENDYHVAFNGRYELKADYAEIEDFFSVDIVEKGTQGNLVTENEKHQRVVDWISSQVEIRTDLYEIIDVTGENWVECGHVIEPSLSEGENQVQLRFRNTATNALSVVYTVIIRYDKSGPTITIQEEQNIFDQLLSVLTFDYYKHKIGISINAEDSYSGVQLVEFSEIDTEEQMTALENALNNGKITDYVKGLMYSEYISDNPLTVENNSRKVFFVHAVDYAGNETFVSSNGIVVDAKEPDIELKWNDQYISGSMDSPTLFSEEDYKKQENFDCIISDENLAQYKCTINGIANGVPEELFSKEWNIEDDAKCVTNQLRMEEGYLNQLLEIALYAKDKAGNDSEKKFYVFIDTIYPTITVTEPFLGDNGFAEPGQDLIYQIKVDDAESGLDILKIVKTNNVKNLTIDRDLDLKTDENKEFYEYTVRWTDDTNTGELTIVFTVSDRAGNSESKTVNVGINSIIPKMNMTISDTEYQKHDDLNYYARGEELNLSIETYYCNNLPENIADYFQIIAVDAAGNPVEGAVENIGEQLAWVHWKEENVDEVRKKYSAVLRIEQDAVYHISFGKNENNELYEDEQGNTAEETSIAFVIDTTAPAAEQAAAHISINGEAFSWDGNWNGNEEYGYRLCTKEMVSISAFAADATSDCIIEYYIHSGEAYLARQELDTMASSAWHTYSESIDLSKEMKGAVYFRAVDRAGNATYFSTDGFVIDQTEPQIKLIPEESHNGKYGIAQAADGVQVQVEITDSAAYSGIESVNCYINDQIYSVQEVTEFIDDYGLVYKRTFMINVDAEIYNGDGNIVRVEAVDRTGNGNDDEVQLDISIVNPVASVSFDGHAFNEYDNIRYYKDYETLTLVIQSRASVFSAENIAQYFNITATDAAGKAVDITEIENQIIRLNDLSAWERGTNDEQDPDATTFTAAIEFNIDANYHVEFGKNPSNELYRDKAGNPLLQKVIVNDFTVDTANPVEYMAEADVDYGADKAEQYSWKEPVQYGFNIFTKGEILVKGVVRDVTSPVMLFYYEYNGEEMLTKDDLELIGEWKDYTEIPYNTNTLATIYFKAADYAGNYIYFSTNAFILDQTSPVIELTPDTPNKNGVYGLSYMEDSVKVKIDVEDPDGGAAVRYSGINMISYSIECDGVETQNGILYSNPDFEKTVDFDSLIQKLQYEIEVDLALNNSDHVVVTVIAADNAGNTSEKQLPLEIDITKPAAEIRFDDNTYNVYDNIRYYQTNEMLTLVITERDSHFDPSGISDYFAISATDCMGNEADISEVLKNIEKLNSRSAWTAVPSAGGKADETTFMAAILFNVDANYQVIFGKNDSGELFHDTADNPLAQTVTVAAFTVDHSKPQETNISIQTSEQKYTWDAAWNRLKQFGYGIYTSEAITVTVIAADATSPVMIDYYDYTGTSVLSDTDLDKLAELNWKRFDPLVYQPDKIGTVYFRVTDYAGNYIYYSSNAYILDKTAPEITLTADTPNENGVYGIAQTSDGVHVKVNVTDPDQGANKKYSGIKSVTYTVENNGVQTQSGILYAYTGENEQFSAHKQNIQTKDIVVDALKNNSDFVVVVVTAVDNAGNKTSASVNLKIDITRPTIEIAYDNDYVSYEKDGRGYYKAYRTATITITERNSNFNASDATNGIRITAPDFDIVKEEMVSGWKTATNVKADETVHTATIRYTADANYTFAIAYTDMAGNAAASIQSSSRNPYKFTIDTKKPEGEITVSRMGSWNKLAQLLSFGLFSRNRLDVSAVYRDETSPIYSVSYFKTDNTKVLTASELENVKWNDYRVVTVNPNERFTVYLRIEDYAGNVQYISTQGIIVDDSAPIEERIAPEINIAPAQTESEIYNRDVNVAITVADPDINGAYSGIKHIRYEVSNMNIVTQEGTLFDFEEKNPVQAQLVREWTGSIKIDSALNNSNEVRVTVYAEDNAGNISSDFAEVKIDITAPVIEVIFDYNDGDTSYDSGVYFDHQRTATISIRERNFDASKVKVSIENTDGYIPVISGFTASSGSGNLDNTVHTATITFASDGDYVFDISYVDEAGNENETVNYGNSLAAQAFTIDLQKPDIQVNYDHTDASHSNYYKETRVATVQIHEHNFDPDRVKITITASDDGDAVELPKISAWNNDGDEHWLTITYEKDALYEFTISCTDMGGNISDTYETDVFYVDRIIPELSIAGIDDKSANKDIVAPVISVSDVNFDSDMVEITLTGARRGTLEISELGEFSDITHGQMFTFYDFARENDIDDIYTLSVKVYDLAGNFAEKSIRFSVNRFGSAYALDERTSILNGSYVNEECDVVIYEVNADLLEPIEILLYKNGAVLTLEKDVDYTVEISGGDGEWYQYTYHIFASNFENDGVYSIVTRSTDAAENVSSNDLDTKNTQIRFAVDKTNPSAAATDLESGKTYPVISKDVTISVLDNLKVQKVVIVLNGIEQVYEGDALDESGNYHIAIEQSNQAQTLSITVYDAANNSTTIEYSDFYVTTNVWVRYYTNKSLVYGSVAGTLLFICFIVFLIVKRKKPKEEKKMYE